MSARPPDQRVRALVDRDECFGFGFCADTLPSVFSLDGEGKSVALAVDADPALMARAADDCPRGAITLVSWSRPDDGLPGA